MKKVVPTVLLLLLLCSSSRSQITSPVIRANFGVDADLRSNYFNGLVQAGNDDWFTLPGSVGTGTYIIDTTGAAAIVSLYNTLPASRRWTFAREMSYPSFSVINNRLLLDAAMVRDYHGDDSTVFASGSNKNGDSPGNWSCPVSQGIPDKNDVLDMFIHVRRAGPNTTDSLWMLAGLSLDNTTGNRYFDFEMYQTDIVYNKTTRTFSGYGPDAGHTSWEFDASGNITRPGDIIFSAEYQSSSLTFIEARIWIDIASLSISPKSFAWSGQFDGASAGAKFGYASIQPIGGGTYYTGLQCGANTWGGPFSIVLQNDVLATDYASKQFVEFSVNLTKLGLDPATSLSGNGCDKPFSSLLVKTRASASFTAELKDFVGPTALFDIPLTDVATTTPSICDEGSVGEVHVVNPLPTSVYHWTTPNGNISGDTTGPSILVDTPGTYIVTQYLLEGCDAYSSDTIQVTSSSGCFVLPVDLYDFRGSLNNYEVLLNWKVLNNSLAWFFEVQRSTDGISYTTAGLVAKDPSREAGAAYSFADIISGLEGAAVYYRIRVVTMNGTTRYSHIITFSLKGGGKNPVTFFPNPTRDVVQLQVIAKTDAPVMTDIFDASGKLIARSRSTVQRGSNIITLDGLVDKPRGIYMAVVYFSEEVYREKIVLTR